MMWGQAVVTLRQSHGLLATALEREDTVALPGAMWLLAMCILRSRTSVVTC